jgi:hypothetical protein
MSVQLNLEDNEVAYLQHVLQTKCLLGEALPVYLKISQQAAMQLQRTGHPGASDGLAETRVE